MSQFFVVMGFTKQDCFQHKLLQEWRSLPDYIVSCFLLNRYSSFLKTELLKLTFLNRSILKKIELSKIKGVILSFKIWHLKIEYELVCDPFVLYLLCSDIQCSITLHHFGQGHTVELFILTFSECSFLDFWELQIYIRSTSFWAALVLLKPLRAPDLILLSEVAAEWKPAR